MKNYWLDKKYPLATAVRDWRKLKDKPAFLILEKTFYEMAQQLASPLLGSQRAKYIDKMEDAAWEHVDKFDLRKKTQCVTYFTNVMKSVMPATVSKSGMVAANRVNAMQNTLRRSAWTRRTP